jgi:membrane protease YdiL (CAAX protease family)
MAQQAEQPDKKKAGLPVAPWNGWGGLIFILLLFFLSQLAAGILISLYPVAKHWTATQGTDWLNNSVTAQFIYSLLVEAIAVYSVYFFAKRYKVGLLAIGVRRPVWRDLLSGLAMAPLYYFAYFVVVAAASAFFKGLDVNQTQQVGFNDVHGAVQLILTFISLVILPPIAEELMMRGVLYSSLKKLMPIWGAVGLTSLLFAAAHLPEGGSGGPLYIGAIDTFVLSLFLIRLRERTNGIWASMVLHATKNGVAFLALFILNVR